MPQTGAPLPLLPLPVEPRYARQHFGDHLEAWERLVARHEPAGREGHDHTAEDDDLQLAAYCLLFPSKGISLPKVGCAAQHVAAIWLACVLGSGRHARVYCALLVSIAVSQRHE